MSDNRPIGLFDSGVGGLTVLRELQQVFPDENFIYLGDSARAPYGSKGKETVSRYSSECLSFLNQCKVKALVVACNTASSAGIAGLKSKFPFPIIDTIEPSAEVAAHISLNGEIAILGTRATVQSKAYEFAILAHRPEAKFAARACPLFVPYVEEGLVSGPLIRSVIAHYLDDMDWNRIDTVILACTHYPLLRNALEEHIGRHIRYVDSAAPIAAALTKLFTDEIVHRNTLPEPGTTQYFVTDDVVRFNDLGRVFLPGREIRAKLARLEE